MTARNRRNKIGVGRVSAGKMGIRCRSGFGGDSWGGPGIRSRYQLTHWCIHSRSQPQAQARAPAPTASFQPSPTLQYTPASLAIIQQFALSLAAPSMLVLTLVQSSSTPPPPLLLPLTASLLTQPVWQLQSLALAHFRDRLSPFLRHYHLQICSDKYIMRPDYPLFIYCTQIDTVTILICSLKAYDQAAGKDRANRVRNAVVVVERGQGYKEKMVKFGELEKLDAMLGKRACIAGREVEIGQAKQWSQIVRENWGRYEGQNGAVYVLI